MATARAGALGWHEGTSHLSSQKFGCAVTKSTPTAEACVQQWGCWTVPGVAGRARVGDDVQAVDLVLLADEALAEGEVRLGVDLLEKVSRGYRGGHRCYRSSRLCHYSHARCVAVKLSIGRGLSNA